MNNTIHTTRGTADETFRTLEPSSFVRFVGWSVWLQCPDKQREEWQYIVVDVQQTAGAALVEHRPLSSSSTSLGERPCGGWRFALILWGNTL